MTKLKSRPISLRIDSDLYEELNGRAEKSSKTFNGYIREKLYEIANLDNSGLNEFQAIDDQFAKTKETISESLGETSKSLMSVMVLTNKLKENIQVIGTLEGVAEDSEEKIKKAQTNYAALQNMIDASIEKIERSQKYALDHLKEVQNAGLIALDKDLNEHAYNLQEKVKTLYNEIYNDLDQEQILLKKKKSEKRANFITMTNYALFFILSGMVTSSVLMYVFRVFPQ